MNDNPIPEGVRELTWRRKLTPAEAARLRAWLAAHPEAAADYDTETVLTEALGRLPTAEVPSNFTARVLQAVERETARQPKHAAWQIWRWRPAWLPRVAVVAVVVGVTVFSAQQVELARHRQQVVRGLVQAAEVATSPAPEVLENFDTVRKIGIGPDEELLAIMQ